MTARLTSGEPNITESASFPAATPSGPKAVSGSSYMSCKFCCCPITPNRSASPSTVAVDCFRPIEMAGRSAVTAASVCVGVSPNSRPSALIPSPACALLAISYKLGMIHTPFSPALGWGRSFFTASAMSVERGDLAGWDGAADIGGAAPDDPHLYPPRLFSLRPYHPPSPGVPRGPHFPRIGQTQTPASMRGRDCGEALVIS